MKDIKCTNSQQCIVKIQGGRKYFSISALFNIGFWWTSFLQISVFKLLISFIKLHQQRAESASNPQLTQILHVGSNLMATLSQAISTNKLRADFWINSLIKLSNDEKKRFFSSSRLISKYDYEIRQFHELIRASDRLSLTYSTIGSIMSDINAVGGTIAKSIHNNQSLISYGLDNRFSILYQLLEKRIQKREEFLLCINSYNDIVLGFLELKREDNYKNLSLETISEIDHQVETPKLSSSSPTYKSKNFLAPSNNKFTFKNETHLIVQFSLHYKVNDKRQVEIIDTIHPNETKIINGPRQFYEVLVSENVNKGEKISAILKTVKAGYGYKIVVHNRDKKFLLISL